MYQTPIIHRRNDCCRLEISLPSTCNDLHDGAGQRIPGANILGRRLGHDSAGQRVARTDVLWFRLGHPDGVSGSAGSLSRDNLGRHVAGERKLLVTLKDLSRLLSIRCAWLEFYFKDF